MDSVLEQPTNPEHQATAVKKQPRWQQCESPLAGGVIQGALIPAPHPTHRTLDPTGRHASCSEEAGRLS